jgi:hypothetical protein
VRAEDEDETRDGAAVGARFHAAAEVREGLVGARGFEPPTSSSRTMRATKLRHAPTEVLVQQSRWIVARAAGFRRGRRRALEASRSRDARGDPFGAATHHLGTLRSPEVPGNRGPPVRTSHFRASAPAVGSMHAPRPATLEWRERAVTSPPTMSRSSRLGGNRMKQDLKARLFGFAVTLSFFGLFIVPLYGKRW